jgi:hypothetical protein
MAVTRFFPWFKMHIEYTSAPGDGQVYENHERQLAFERRFS